MKGFLFLLPLLAISTAYAEPRIHRVEPLCLEIGKTTEVTVFGDKLAPSKDKTGGIWTDFGGKWEYVKTDKPQDRERTYRVTLPKETQPGPGAIRAWSDKGISLPFLLLKSKVPALSFRLQGEKPFTHTFPAKKGEKLAIELWSNRLNQDTDLVLSIHQPSGKKLAFIDDDEVTGSDPFLRFTSAEDGDYTLTVHDIQWRNGAQACLSITRAGDSKPPKGRLTSNNPEPIPLDLQAGQYLTLTPETRAIGSPALLLLELHNPDGQRVAQSGTGDALDEILRRKVQKTGTYQLKVRDLLRREGLPFNVQHSTCEAPFTVQLEDRAKDRHLLKPGAELKLKFRITRYDCKEPITIECPELVMSNNTTEPGKNEVEATVRVPEDAKAGSLLAFRFRALATINDKIYATHVQTRGQLKKTPAHLAKWPDGLIGMNYAVITGK